MKKLLALAFAGAFSFQAQAQDPMKGNVLLCDTAEQVEFVVRHVAATKDIGSALDSVNQKFGKNACAVQPEVFQVIREIKRLSNHAGEAAIVYGLVQSWSPPVPQFSVVIIRIGLGV